MSKITDKPYQSVLGVHKSRKYATKEEAYEAHKTRKKKWQQENLEKHRANVKKYNAKPERAALLKERAHDRYAAQTPEQLEERRRQQREFYAANKERISETMKARYYAKKALKALDENSTT